MRIIGAADLEAVLFWRDLVEALRRLYRSGSEPPPNSQYPIPREQPDGLLSVSTAWQDRRHIGIGMTTRFAGNQDQGKPTVMGTYMLLSARTGQPLALLDGRRLTQKCTAGLSALASTYLSRNDASRLLMIGTGGLAASLILSHAAVRPITDVLVWGRNFTDAKKLAKALRNQDFTIDATADLPDAVDGAHIVCCATSAREPVLQGAWLSPGVHVDLVGSVTPDMRETDDAVMERARVFVDLRNGALATGDLAIPIANGVITDADIAGDMIQLTQGEIAGRRYYDQITLFKSCGSALTDLAGAQIALERT